MPKNTKICHSGTDILTDKQIIFWIKDMEFGEIKFQFMAGDFLSK